MSKPGYTPVPTNVCNDCTIVYLQDDPAVKATYSHVQLCNKHAAAPEQNQELRATSIDLWAWIEREDVPEEVASQMRLRARAIDAVISKAESRSVHPMRQEPEYEPGEGAERSHGDRGGEGTGV